MSVLRPVTISATLFFVFGQSVYADQPSTPVNFTAAVYSQTAAELFWQRAADNGTIRGYEITQNGNSLGIFDALSLFQDDLVAGVSYTYDIAAIDTDGNRSTTSSVTFTAGIRIENPEQENSAVPEPTNLSVAVYSDSALELFWDRITTDTLSYEVIQNGQSLGTTNGTSFFVDGLAAGQLYSFDVQAINNAGDRSAVSNIDVGSNTQTPDNGGPDTLNNGGSLNPPLDTIITNYSTSVAELSWINTSNTGTQSSVEILRNNIFVANSNGSSFYDDARPVDTNATYSLTTVTSEGQRSETIQIGQFESTKLDTSVGLLAKNDYGKIALSGNTAALPADREQTDSDIHGSGAVYVFTRDTDDVWGQTQKITSDENARRFGLFTAIDGDTLAISHRDNGDIAPDTGSIRGVTMYTRDSSGQWVVSQRISALTESRAYRFGNTIAISGDTMMIQANTNFDGSIVFVYGRNGEGEWIQQHELMLDAEDNGLGSDIDIDGNTAIIGDYRDGTNGFLSGAAWIYAKDESGSWVSQQQLQPDANGEGDFVGTSVALEGDVAVLGGEHSDIVYLFSRDDDGNWSQSQTLDYSFTDRVSNNVAGTSVGLDNNLLAVGVDTASALGRLTGAIYLYVQTDNVWSRAQIFASSNGQSGGLFGTAVAIDDDTLVGTAFPPFTGDRPNGSSVTGYAFDVSHSRAGDNP
ncbi:MAG: hypothetical protein AB8B79_17475 [Granulosicoccus sp.]